jgi:hypothetical protein
MKMRQAPIAAPVASQVSRREGTVSAGVESLRGSRAALAPTNDPPGSQPAANQDECAGLGRRCRSLRGRWTHARSDGKRPTGVLHVAYACDEVRLVTRVRYGRGRASTGVRLEEVSRAEREQTAIVAVLFVATMERRVRVQTIAAGLRGASSPYAPEEQGTNHILVECPAGPQLTHVERRTGLSKFDGSCGCRRANCEHGKHRNDTPMDHHAPPVRGGSNRHAGICPRTRIRWAERGRAGVPE